LNYWADSSLRIVQTIHIRAPTIMKMMLGWDTPSATRGAKIAITRHVVLAIP